MEIWPNTCTNPSDHENFYNIPTCVVYITQTWRKLLCMWKKEAPEHLLKKGRPQGLPLPSCSCSLQCTKALATVHLLSSVQDRFISVTGERRQHPSSSISLSSVIPTKLIMGLIGQRSTLSSSCLLNTTLVLSMIDLPSLYFWDGSSAQICMAHECSVLHQM